MLKALLFAGIFVAIIATSRAQDDPGYYLRVAGDSALSVNKNLLTKDIGRLTTFKLQEGSFRIAFSSDIDTRNDLKIDIFDGEKQDIEFHKYPRHVDFVNKSSGEVNIFVEIEEPGESNVVGKIFWLYSLNVRRQAPGINFKDLSGKLYTNEDLKGKIVVINFWKIGHGPCHMEMPSLNYLVRRYVARKDIVFLAISPDPIPELKRFVKQESFQYKLVSYPESKSPMTQFVDLGMYAIPAHAIIDKEGDVVFQYLGGQKSIDEVLSSCIDKHLH